MIKASQRLLALLTVLAGALYLTAPPATADSPTHIAGRVQCSNGSVSWVWIEAQSSPSGWAKLSTDYGAGVLGVMSALYDFDLTGGGSYRVKVGCQDAYWTSEAATDWIDSSAGNQDFACGTTHPLLAWVGNWVFGRWEFVGAVKELKFDFSSGVPYGDCEAADTPSQIPAVGPAGPDSASSTTNGTTRVAGLRIRSGPYLSSPVLALIPQAGTRVPITCQVDGDVVTSEQATTLWDRVTYNGITGYATDALIDTGTFGRVAPDC